MPILYTLYIILYTFLAWRRLNWAVLLLIFALPSYLIRFSVGPVPVTLLEAMIIILVVVWLIKKFLFHNYQFPIFNKFPISNFQFLLVLFLLAATLSIFISPNLRTALGIWKSYFIEPILFFVVLRDLLEYKKENGVNFGRSSQIDTGIIYPSQIIFVLSFSALILSVFAIYQHFTGFWIPAPWAAAAGRRVTSLFEYPNALGLFLGPLIPLFIGQLLSRKKLLVTGYWLLVTLVNLLAIIWAHSTGALVGVAAGLIFMGSVWLFLFLRNYTKFYILHFTFYICALVVLLGLSFKILPGDFKKELFLNDWSGQVRQQMWKETWAMLKTRPVLGAGLAGYQTAVAPFHKDKNIEIFLYPHSWIFNFWSETGLLGLAAFILLIINFFYLGFKKLFIFYCHSRESGNPETRGWMPDQVRHDIAGRKIIIIAAMASMTVILIHGLVDVPYFKNDLAILFWLIYALVV